MTKIFISYSRKDLAFVEKLAADLTGAGFDVWYDLSGLDGGSRWSVEIDKAIRASDHVIMVVSPDSIKSKWVEEEFLLAGELKKNIVPLHYRASEIPFGYRTLHFLDIQGSKYQQSFHLITRALGTEDLHEAVKPKRNYALLIGVVIAVLLGGGLYGALAKKAEPTPTLLPEMTFTPSISPTEEETVSPTRAVVPDGVSDIDPAGNIIPMQFVGAGEFIMGSTAADGLLACEESEAICQLEWFTDSEPVHTVDVDAFMIDTYETTNALYQACVDAGACTAPTSVVSNSHADYYTNHAYADFPVINVTWVQAQNYCEWRGGRLPTEAEWEKAARGTSGNMYPWGAGLDASFANYYAKVGDTTAVGSYSKGISPYGLYDMAGNVWEWTLSKNNPYPYVAGDGREALDGNNFRIMRGGAWGYVGVSVSSSHRYGLDPAESNIALGFRCAKDAIISPATENSTPTPAPSPTITPDPFANGFELVSMDETVYRGGEASATIRTQPDTYCTLTFFLPSGTMSNAAGVGPCTTDADGYCTWTWDIRSNVNPGYGNIVIIVDEQQESFPVEIR